MASTKKWTCATCKGSGSVRVWYKDENGKNQSHDTTCSICGGSGEITWKV